MRAVPASEPGTALAGLGSRSQEAARRDAREIGMIATSAKPAFTIPLNWEARRELIFFA